MVKDKPLNFLDHHIKCGNSLVGATPELIGGGVPDGAFEPITGDNKKIASEAKRINKKQRANKTLDAVGRDSIKALMEKFSRLSAISEDSSTGVVDKCKAYHMLQKDTEFQRLKLVADAWTAASFVPLDGSLDELPTTAEVRRLGLRVMMIPWPLRFERWQKGTGSSTGILSFLMCLQRADLM